MHRLGWKPVLWPYPIMMLFVALIVAGLSTPGQAIGVRPLVLDLHLRPGDVAPFDIVFSSSGIQETVNLRVYEPKQQTDGTLHYTLPRTDEFPPAAWVSLAQEQVVVRPGEEVRIPGEVRVPFDAGGSYPIVVMVEPEVDVGTGVTILVRYAVRLQVHVERAGLRPMAEVVDFGLVADADNGPALMMHVRNPSRLLYNVAAEVTIRDESRRLVERIPVFTEASAQTGADETPVYPGADVLFFGKLTEPLYPGNYELRLFMRYAQGRQIVETRSVHLTGEEFDQTERMRPVAVTPDRIDVTLRPGGVATVPLELRNRTDEPVQVRLGARPIHPEYGHSVFDAVDIQSRGETEFSVPSRRNGRTVLIFQAPRDIVAGGYYGYIDVDVFSGADHRDAVRVPVAVAVPGPWEAAADVLDVAYEWQDDFAVFSVHVRNSSTMHFAPTGTVYLTDEQGVAVRTIRLELEEDVPYILPDRSGQLIGLAVDMEPGEYTAHIYVQFEQQDLDGVDVPVTIDDARRNER